MHRSSSGCFLCSLLKKLDGFMVTKVRVEEVSLIRMSQMREYFLAL